MTETFSEAAARQYRQDHEYGTMRALRFPREVVIDRLLFQARGAITDQILEDAEWRIEQDLKRRISTYIARMFVPGKQKSETVVVAEEPRYPTWKHMLVDELPKGSFRRRFLERFFRINTLERRIVTHTFTADTGFAFPECRLRFPDSFGHISFLTDARSTSEALDYPPSKEEWPDNSPGPLGF